jgi:hypothetical protein
MEPANGTHPTGMTRPPPRATVKRVHVTYSPGAPEMIIADSTTRDHHVFGGAAANTQVNSLKASLRAAVSPNRQHTRTNTYITLRNRNLDALLAKLRLDHAVNLVPHLQIVVHVRHTDLQLEV